MATTAFTYSDDKIVVDPSDDQHGDPKSQSSATAVESASDGKTASPHDDKVLSAPGFSPPDDKIPAVESPNHPTASTEKQALTGHTGSDQKIPVAAPNANAYALPAEKISAVEPDDFSAPQRPPTDASSWGGSPTTTATTATTRTAPRVYREYGFHHTTAWKMNHNVVVDPNNQAMYLIAVSGFAKGREDVVLHSISDGMAGKGTMLTAEEGKTCPGVAFAQFPHKKPDVVQLALGDSGRMSHVRWFELGRGGEGEDWRLSVSDGQGAQMTFRLATAGLGELETTPETPHDDGWSTLGSFRFVEAEQGVPLASYTEQKAMTSWKKRGKLRIYDRALGDAKVLSEVEMEQLLILCCAVLNEKRRRKTVRKWAGMGMI